MGCEYKIFTGRCVAAISGSRSLKRFGNLLSDPRPTNQEATAQRSRATSVRLKTQRETKGLINLDVCARDFLTRRIHNR